MRSAVVGMAITALGIVGSTTLVAQGKTTLVTGVVSDQEGTRLVGATIELLGTRLSASSNEQGEFRLGNVPSGRYWIIARRIGFAPIRFSATFTAGQDRALPITLESVPQRLSELTVLAHAGMNRYRYQDFQMRSHSAFGTFLTRDDLVTMNPYDVISAVQRHMPGRTRYALERRTGGFDFAGGMLYRRGRFVYARDEFGSYIPVGRSALDVYSNPNCSPAISLNGSTPMPGVSLADFDVDQVEALEIYRRGSWVPTEFAYRENSGCGLVVVWTR